MGLLGNGLQDAKHYEDALSVYEAELSMWRRVGASELNILAVQANLASTYEMLRRSEEALRLRRDVYSGNLKLQGEEELETLLAANNYANTLNRLERFEEAKSLMRKTVPVARSVLGDSNGDTIRIRSAYAEALYKDDGATLDDLREAVATFEDAGRIARRVFGGVHPITEGVGLELLDARAALRAREMRQS